VIIDGVKNLTGLLEYTENVWLTNCEFNNAQLAIDGDLYVDGPCVFTNTDIHCTGDIVFRIETIVKGGVTAQSVFTHDPCRFDNITCKKLFTKGEVHFDTLVCETARFYGSCFGNRIWAFAVWMDGDIIANLIKAGEVYVERGSILVKRLEVEKAKADIIGNYSRDRLNEEIHKFKWARPMVEGAEPKTSESSDTILNGYLVLKSCISHIPELAYVLEKYSKVNSCTEFSSEKETIFSDIKKYYSRLSPASQQFIECIEAHGFPDLMWRF